MRAIYAASAVAPCTTHAGAMKEISKNLIDPLLGPISAKKVQLCPQHSGYLCENRIAEFLGQYPETEFRLHASPKLRGESREIVYVSNARACPDYIRHALRLTHMMKPSGYSLHAGRREHMDMNDLFGEARRLEDMAGTRMAVEGLYPDSRKQWLVSTWAEYEALANSGLGFALDLSHLNIVTRKEGRQDRLVEDMAALETCVEIHLSHNCGRADKHLPMKANETPWWMNAFLNSHPDSDVFYEGILVAPSR